MRNQLRPGGLAIITGCSGGAGLVVNIGKVVDVIKFIPMDTPFTVNGKVGMHSVAVGFGLVRRDQCVLLKRRKSPSDLFHRKGYAYHTDSKGRMMIQGDYDNELNIAYIKMLGEPMEVKMLTVCGPDPIGHQYVANGSALIYLTDLEVLAKWCGDKVIINGNKASIKSGLSS